MKSTEKEERSGSTKWKQHLHHPSFQNTNPEMTEAEVFSLVYPRDTILRRDTEQSILDQFVEKFKIQKQPNKATSMELKQIDRQQDNIANLKLDCNGTTLTLTARCGNESLFGPLSYQLAASAKHPHLHKFVSTDAIETFLSQISLTHASGADFCILGYKGSGKTTVITEFAKRFGYSIETIALYNDMNSRDLLQSRRILPNGDTVWWAFYSRYSSWRH